MNALNCHIYRSVICYICAQNILKSNFSLHEIGCARANRLKQAEVNATKPTQQQQQAKKTAPPPKASPAPAPSVPKPKTLSQKLAHIDDDDELLDAAIAAQSGCWFAKCKARTAMIGTTCPHCANRYCLEHAQPEVHGCGDAAKADARRGAVSAGKSIVSGVLLPSKDHLRPEHRKFLEGKLHRAVESKADDRTAKPSKKK